MSQISLITEAFRPILYGASPEEIVKLLEQFIAAIPKENRDILHYLVKYNPAAKYCLDIFSTEKKVSLPFMSMINNFENDESEEFKAFLVFLHNRNKTNVWRRRGDNRKMITISPYDLSSIFSHTKVLSKWMVENVRESIDINSVKQNLLAEYAVVTPMGNHDDEIDPDSDYYKKAEEKINDLRSKIKLLKNMTSN